MGDFRKFNFKLFLLIILLSIFFGFLFALIREPIPAMFESIFRKGFWKALFFLAGSSFVVAFSEQIIFTGFLYNTYSKLTSKYDAGIQVSILFVMFHILRFKILVNYYHTVFSGAYLFYLLLYYLFLFVFMITCIYFYSLNSKKYKGNFFYPVTIHFITDFSLFVFTMLGFGLK